MELVVLLLLVLLLSFTVDPVVDRLVLVVLLVS